MRTTVSLSPDVAAAVARMQREQGIGVSEALNELVRRGLAQRVERGPFVQKTSPMRLRVDVANVAEALELLEGSSHR